MAVFICLFLLVGFADKNAASAKHFEDSEGSNNYFNLLQNDFNLLKNSDSNYADLFNNNYGNYSDLKFDFDAGNPDIHAIIERPCEIYDTFCIRRFFAEHSKCRISAEPVPEPLFRAQTNIGVPSLNLTVTQVNLNYTGLRTARVEEFYINKATDNLVITIGLDFMAFTGYGYVKFNRRGREPVVTSDYNGIRAERLSITVVIPHLDNLRLDKADISTFLHVPVYSYFVNPGLIPRDPELLPTFAVFSANLQLNQLEAFLTEGNFVAAKFIQYNICDFGLKVL